MRVVDLGLKGYKETWDFQLETHRKRVERIIDDTLILVEHKPVITVGKSGDVSNLLVQPEELKKRGIEMHHIERGGDVTFHGPGQLVGYPIFEIKSGFAGIRPFIRTLEDVVLMTLNQYGIYCRRGGHPGIWVEDKKILSIGIAVKRWVSMHGFALNVNNDASDFSIINPCGHVGLQMTSIKEILGKPVAMDLLKKKIVGNFEKIINAQTELVKD